MGRKKRCKETTSHAPCLQGGATDGVSDGDSLLRSAKTARSHWKRDRPDLEWVRLGVIDHLDGASCARLALCAQGLCAATAETVSGRIAATLIGSCIWADRISTSKATVPQPFLALSHLESLAQSQFLFASFRALLRAIWDDEGQGVSSTFLEADGTPESLCDIVLQARPGKDSDEEDLPSTTLSSSAARLASLLYHFEPKTENWVSSFESFLGYACASAPRRGRQGGGTPRDSQVEWLRSQGGDVEQLMLGVPELLPKTKTASLLAKTSGRLDAMKLLTQMLERLSFPVTSVEFALEIALPLTSDAGQALSKWQSQAFKRNLELFQREFWPSGSGQLFMFAIKAANRHYVLALEC
eukprot:TRINITY_DN54938_c0_g1_i1.p1 TRINITY_DN54938_c0_g1~~TRINITY_DN54938_c0_g1_i1.p1  ORF type:complete len:356 (-),score=48.61 TRINITY_DN54938_c0_g1_i1:84-1151(-)